MPKAGKNTKRKTPKYEQILAMDDDKINVLILGTSGCGKSTLINSILEANEAPTGVGEATTKEISLNSAKTESGPVMSRSLST